MESLLYFGCRELRAGEGPTPVQSPIPPPPVTQQSGGKRFYRREGGLNAETVQSALIIILKLVIRGLTSVILTVLSTVNLRFQGCLSACLENSSRNCGSIYHSYNRSLCS